MTVPMTVPTSLPRLPVRAGAEGQTGGTWRHLRHLSRIAAVTFAVLLLALVGTQSAFAQEFPKLSGRVVDAANLLSPEQEAQLTQLSAEIEQASSRQFVIATIPDLQDYPIEDYGYRLGREWGIGQEGANNGIILIVAPNEKKVRIEVGYGLEPVVPDGLASDIIQQTILPRFRDGDMAGGIIAGAQAIGEQMKLPLEAAEARAREQMASSRSSASKGAKVVGVLMGLFWTFVIMAIVIAVLSGKRGRGRRYRHGGWGPVIIWGPGWGDGHSHHRGSGWGGSSGWGGGGGGFGGGGFSGGGGSFGGGGASGGW